MLALPWRHGCVLVAAACKQQAASNCAAAAAALFALQPHTPPATFAVCSPLRKPALRRLAAAEAPPPPPPAGESQPASQLRDTATQAAPGAKQGWSFDPPLWQVKLAAIGVCLLSAALAFRQGAPNSAMVHLFVVIVLLMPPW